MAPSEELLASSRWTEASVWLIAYADHMPDAGQTPLAALGSFVGEHLDRIVDGVHILPFAPWSSDGGFAVIDYEKVDARYGTWADVEAIAKERPVMFDAVINHMSAESSWFQSFLAGEPEFAGFFRTSDPSLDTSAVVRPRTSPLLTPFDRSAAAPRPAETVHVWTTFSPDQVDLDYANPEVLLRILDVLANYCQHGAAAIRLDAVGFLWKDETSSSIHLPETHQLIQLMRSFLDAVSPGTILVSETNVPHAENVSYLGARTADRAAVDEVHAVYQFPLAPLAAHAALTGDTSALERWAAGIDHITGPGRSFLNFLACHDGVGVRPAEGLLEPEQLAVLIDACRASGGLVSDRLLPDGSTSPYELNTTWFDLMRAGAHVEGAGGGEAEQQAIGRHLATHAVMLSLPGVGLLYAQSIIGASNDHEAVAETNHQRDINRTRFSDRDALIAELSDHGRRGQRISTGLARLVAARRSSPAFHPEGSMAVVDSPPGVFAIDRAHDGHRARVIVNLSSQTIDVSALTNECAGTVAPAALLEPYDSLWLTLASPPH